MELLDDEREIIHIWVHRFILSWVQPRFHVAQQNANNRARGRGRDNGAKGTGPRKPNSKGKGRVSDRKKNSRQGGRTNRGDEELSDSQDDDGGEAPEERSEVEDDPGRKFACPYFQHDPAKYGTRRVCCGPGFTTVHRVK
jgi:hypothetical protein